MTFTFLTSVYFRHDTYTYIYIYKTNVFHMTSRSITSVYFTWYQMKTISSTDGWRRRRNHSIIGLTFLQLYRKWWQYHKWSFCPCELKQEALYVLLICYLPSIQVIYNMCISDMISTCKFKTSVFFSIQYTWSN